MRLHNGLFSRALVILLLPMGACCTSAAVGQTAATVPSNYKGPNLTGRCAYITKEGAFYSGLMTISGYFRFDAERSFRQYAMAHADAGTTPRAFCRWLTKEQMKSPSDLDVHATGTGGQQMKAVQVNWQYVPGSGGTVASTAQNGATTARPAGTAAAQNGTAGGSGSSLSGAGSGTGSAISDSVNGSKQQIASAAASSMTDATTTAMGAVTGWMHRPKKTADTPAGTAAGQQPGAAAGNADEQAMFGPAPNTAAAATGAPVAGPPGSVGSSVAGASGKKGSPFLFCHLKATGSEYYSDVFPAGDDGTDDAATRAFWKQVAHQYKTGSIPYRDNAVCTRAASEQEALSARQGLMSSAPARGLAKEKVVDTAWTYMGEDEK